MKPTYDVKLIIALAGVAIIWGTTYLGIGVAVKTIPAWYVTAIRQAIAAIIVLVILLYNKELKWIGWQNLWRQCLISFAMVVIANGLTTVAEKTVPTGVTSLINSLSPLFVFIVAISFGLQKTTGKGIVGIFLGLVGGIFIFRSELSNLLNPGYVNGILALLIALSGWTAGTIYSKIQSSKPVYIFLNLFYQFSFAAIVQFLIAGLIYEKVDVTQWAPSGIIAIVYLAIFGSVLGFFCYHYALKRVTPSEVSILTYFNTIIAVFLGWLILDERVSMDLVFATILIIAGVMVTNYKKKSIQRDIAASSIHLYNRKTPS